MNGFIYILIAAIMLTAVTISATPTFKFLKYKKGLSNNNNNYGRYNSGYGYGQPSQYNRVTRYQSQYRYPNSYINNGNRRVSSHSNSYINFRHRQQPKHSPGAYDHHTNYGHGGLVY